MLRPPPLFLLLFLLSSPAACDFYTLTTRFSADPSPLVVGDRLYVHATHDEDHMEGFAMKDYNVFSTTDAVNWRDDGIAFSPIHNTTWAKNAWAPQVAWHEPLQRFLMFFPGMGDPSVGVAAATDPRGPFTDYAMQAIAPGEDPTIFVDDDGTPILCTATNSPYNMPWCGVLAPDMKSWARNQSQLFINGLQPGNFFEAPWLFKWNGVYYLSFMEDHAFGAAVGAPFGWSLGYATNNSTDPLGNYTYRGPLMWANPLNCDNAAQCGDALGSVGGNAHHGFALDFPTGSGKHWLLYHTRGLVTEKHMATFSQRNVAIDRVYFSNDTAGGGLQTPVTSTPNWVRQLHWVDPYSPQPAVSFAGGSSLFLGTQPAAACDPQGGMWRYLWNASHGDFLLIRGVDFSAIAPTFFTARVAVGEACTGCALEARLGGGGGAVIASLPISNTGGWEEFHNVTGPVVPFAAGIADLALMFVRPGGMPGRTFHLVSWGFSGPGAAAAAAAAAASTTGASASVPPPLLITTTLRSSSTGLLVTVDDKDGHLTASGHPDSPGAAQIFQVEDGEDGFWGLKGLKSGQWVRATTAGGVVAADSPGWGEGWARTQWRLVGTPDGTYTLLAKGGGG